MIARTVLYWQLCIVVLVATFFNICRHVFGVPYEPSLWLTAFALFLAVFLTIMSVGVALPESSKEPLEHTHTIPMVCGLASVSFAAAVAFAFSIPSAAPAALVSTISFGGLSVMLIWEMVRRLNTVRSTMATQFFVFLGTLALQTVAIAYILRPVH